MFVFSTLQSRSCVQLTNSCLLRGREGSLLWIDILTFFVTDWYIFEVGLMGVQYDEYVLVRVFSPCSVVVSQY